MSEKQVTGPNDDEQYGHGGVDVPTDHLESLPNVDDDEADTVDEADDAAVGGGPAGLIPPSQ